MVEKGGQDRGFSVASVGEAAASDPVSARVLDTRHHPRSPPAWSSSSGGVQQDAARPGGRSLSARAPQIGIERPKDPSAALLSATARCRRPRPYEEWPEGRVRHPVRALEGLLVLALVKVLPEGSEMHPTSVIGIEFHRATHDRRASLELARVHDL